MSKDKPAPYDMSIHSNSSALAWTKFFRECNPECNLNDEVMLGWFANAMMAMHDHIYQTSPPKREPLSDTEIFDLWIVSSVKHIYDLVRSVEKVHGIGVDNG